MQRVMGSRSKRFRAVLEHLRLCFEEGSRMVWICAELCKCKCRLTTFQGMQALEGVADLLAAAEQALACCVAFMGCRLIWQ